MVKIRTRTVHGRRVRYPINKWAKEALGNPATAGTLRAAIKRLYGSKAFTKEGTIKHDYLLKTKKHAQKTGNVKLLRKVQPIINLQK